MSCKMRVLNWPRVNFIMRDEVVFTIGGESMRIYCFEYLLEEGSGAMSDPKNKRNCENQKFETFADVMLPSSLLSGFVTILFVLFGVFSFFFLFPILLPNIAYDYMTSPDVRIIGSFDLYSIIYVQIFAYRLYLFQRFLDSLSLTIILRSNAILSLLCALVVMNAAVIPFVKLLFCFGCLVVSVANGFGLACNRQFETRSALIWNGVVLLISFKLLRYFTVIEI